MKIFAGIVAILFLATLIAPAFGQPVVGDLVADGPDSNYELIIGDVAVTPIDEGSDGDIDALAIEIRINNPYQYPGDGVQTNWFLNETHMQAALSLAGIPQSGAGNPKIGKFEFSESYDDLGPGATTSGTYVWALPSDNFEGTVYIAAQAVVSEWDLTPTDHDGDGVPDPLRYETAWGYGDQFNPSRSWAMYFTYSVDQP